VILAVIAATTILACASSSAALFLSSASSESLRRIVAADCPDASYPTVQVGPMNSVPPGNQAALEVPLGANPPTELNIVDLAGLDRRASAALTGAGLAAPQHVAVGESAVYATPDGGAHQKRVQLLYRDGAAANITPLRQGPARGVWVPAGLASQLSLRPGQPLRLGFIGGPQAAVPVAGIYRDLFFAPTTPFWCSYGHLFQNPASVDPPPPALVLPTDAGVFADVQHSTGVPATHLWASPISTDHLTLSAAQDLVHRQNDAYRRLGVPAPADFGTQNTGPGQLPAFAGRTALIRDGLRGPVVPIALGGTILALLLVGAAGSYWADRRSREVRLLSSRGVGPGALAAKAVLELAAPALAGTVLGWLAARWLVRTLGPNPHLDRAAPGQAAVTAAIGLLAGLALLALVAGLRSRGATERPIGARLSWAAVVPWELALLAGAAGCYGRLRGGNAVLLDHNVAQVKMLVVAFPLLFLVGGSIVVVRLLALLLPRLGRLAGRRSAAWYLAARRITASRVVSVTLLAAASTPIAVLVYAAGLTQTSQYTLDAKARLFVGSDIAVSTTDQLTRTAATDRVGTVVVRFTHGRVGDQDVQLLAIDPDTFAGTAFWDRRFADLPLPQLLAMLRAPTAGGRVPAIAVAGADLGPRFDVTLGASTGRLETVASTRLFPGGHLPQPLIVVSAARLGPVDEHAGTMVELWSSHPTAEAEAAVRAQRARVFDTTDQLSVFQAANFLGISWTFGYLTALAALVGLVAAGGLLLYLETRQRSRVASYALGRRMGLSRATHLRSLLAELGSLLLAACAVGAALGWAAVLLVYQRLDVDTDRPPPPLLTTPVVALVGCVAAVVAVATLAALYAQRSADRADVAEVLRLG